MNVVVIDCGVGNLRSLVSALQRAGAQPAVTENPDDVLAADLAVLPGVGAAASAMTLLRERGIDVALRQRLAAGRATLGICLGMQLAVEHSEENGGTECLGLIPGSSWRISAERVPRMGWAAVQPWDEDYYFAHSYAVSSPAAVASSEGLTAAVRSGSFLGVQFHPEKSGRAGERFLRQCLTAA